MAQELKTNTAVWLCVGPFYDKTDGVTPEVALTVANSLITLIAETDDGSAPTLILDNVAGNDGTNTLVHITDDDAGYYYLKLSAANVNRLGRMKLAIEDAANHCPVFHELEIVSAQYYTAKYGSGNFYADAKAINGVSTSSVAAVGAYIGNATAAIAVDANGRLDIIKIAGTTQTARDIGASVLLSSGTGTGQLSFTSGIVKADIETIKTQTVTCAAGVTVLASVGTAATSTAQTGDTYALANGATGFTAIDTVVDAIKVKTDYLPSVIAGGAGGVFIAGTNAATSITTALTANITGNLSGTVGSVTGAVGSITGITFPTNFADLSISVTTGFVDITQGAADKVWGTAARVLTANTNLTNLEVDITKIHGTALTETAGQLAGAFIKFFDVATPTGTVNSIPDAVAGAAGGIAIVGSDVNVASMTNIDFTALQKTYVETRTLLSADYVVVTDTIAAVTTIPAVTLANGTHGGAAASITLADYSDFKATGFSTHSAADVKTAIEAGGSSIASILADTGELQTNQGNWVTATGFSTHSAADVAALVLVTPAQKIVTDANGYVTYSNTAPLDAAGVATAVWNAAVLTYGSAGSYGLLIETNLDAQVSGVTAPTAADVADAVWEEAIADHATGTTFGGKNQKVVPSETINDYKATGFSTHSAADVANLILVTPAQKLVTDANGYVTYSNAAPPSTSDIKTAMEAAGGTLALSKIILDKVDTMTVIDGAVYQFTANALELATSSGLDAAGVRTAIGLSSANLDTQLADIPTVTEFEARSLVTAEYATAAILKEINQSLNGKKIEVDRGNNTYKVFDTDGTTLLFTITKTVSGNVDTLTRTP